MSPPNGFMYFISPKLSQGRYWKVYSFCLSLSLPTKLILYVDFYTIYSYVRHLKAWPLRFFLYLHIINNKKFNKFYDQTVGLRTCIQ